MLILKHSQLWFEKSYVKLIIKMPAFEPLQKVDRYRMSPVKGSLGCTARNPTMYDISKT